MKSYVKLLILCALLISINIVCYVMKALYKSQDLTKTAVLPRTLRKAVSEYRDLKYILIWTSELNFPLFEMGQGEDYFIGRKCPYCNCFVTNNKSFFEDYRNFDVIVFSGTVLSEYHYEDLTFPELRSPYQKYVFASIESPDQFPVCDKKYDNFFNWTWTFKLDSDITWNYIAIRDINSNLIGPKKDMKWLKPEEMLPVSYEFKQRLLSKHIFAAWIIPNFDVNAKRRAFVDLLQKELNRIGCPHSICRIDIFTKNEIYKCLLDKDEMCYKVLREKYYFYLSLESALSPDFVTALLLAALNNNVVPIVYGGADYSRFLPEGSYLDAKKLGYARLAEEVKNLLNNPEKYADYFKWNNHYIYQSPETEDTNINCKICALLNDDRLVKSYSLYMNFTRWWNTPEHCLTKQLLLENLSNRSLYNAQMSKQLFHRGS